LDFNVETLRITDPDPDGDGQTSFRPAPQPSPNDIMNKLKPTATVTPFNSSEITDNETGEITKKVTVDVKGAKLNQLLNQIRSKN
jgi:hypothetical protein